MLFGGAYFGVHVQRVKCFISAHHRSSLISTFLQYQFIMELYHTIKYVTREIALVRTIFFIVIAGAFLLVRFWAQKKPQLGWLWISANRTIIFLRQRIFRRNIFSIPAVLEMGVEVFRKGDIFVLRYYSVQNNISSAHFTYRRHKPEIVVTISCIGGKPLFYK